MSMSKVFTPSNRWFQAYSPQHYTHYIKIKCLSEWAHGAYEKIYVHLGKSPAYECKITEQEAIATSKHFLNLARRLGSEAQDYPAPLRHLMKLDWVYCIKSCIRLQEIIKGNIDREFELLELERSYIAQKSQFVDEDDLDIRLGRSSNAFAELGRKLNSSKVPEVAEFNAILDKANKPLEIDLEEMIIQVKDSVDHMLIKNQEDKLSVYIIKNYDDRFAMQRKAIKFLRELMKSIKTSEDYTEELDVKLLNESETIPIELNHLYFCSSKFLICGLMPNELRGYKRF